MQEAEVDKVIGRVNRAVDKVEEMAGGNRNTTRVEVAASSSPGAILALVIAGVMFGLNLALLFNLAAHDRKIERMQDHLNAIYMMAPHLKPKDKPL